jgi:hypothetical protein
VLTESDCHAGTQLLQSYRRFVLAALELLPAVDGRASSDPITVTLVSRRPYNKFVDHAFMGRQVTNEDALVAAMKMKAAHVEAGGAPLALDVQLVDFAQLETAQQLRVVAGTEILVGMHGAALTYALYMPPHGAVVEMWPKARDMWRVFEHASTMAGLQYLRWENTDPSAFYSTERGDFTTINVESFMRLFETALAGVIERRAAGTSFVPPGGNAHARL